MVELFNSHLKVVIAPDVGGKIVEFVDRKSGYDFLWRNPNLPLQRESAGSPYDPNFYGGIDELFPNDIEETIGQLPCPDHGEIWTAPFDVVQTADQSLTVKTLLPVTQVEIVREIILDEDACRVRSEFINHGGEPLPFLWKLHAAVAIEPGDLIQCSAQRFEVADAVWSRRTQDGEWRGETIPEFDRTTEFLYLHDLKEGRVGWSRGGKSFEIEFDLAIFPYTWYFASYGGFDGHHVAILEPCTTVPISVREAFGRGTCPVLDPDARLVTTYTYRGRVS
jgi:galactose mutarotase-like enzyme